VYGVKDVENKKERGCGEEKKRQKIAVNKNRDGNSLFAYLHTHSQADE
jgi:hypothetical protein